ncbi:MAG TPA: hypothetical protein VF275_05425 [Gammaproteobacteria bacterium]
MNTDAINDIRKAAEDCIEEVIRYPKLPRGWADEVGEVMLDYDIKLVKMLDPATVLELCDGYAKLAKVRVLRDEVNSFTRSPQKKDHKERARELGNCIANIKNDLDAILEERTS